MCEMNRRRVQILERPGGAVIRQTYIDDRTTMDGLMTQVSSILSVRVDTISVVRGSGTSVINSTRDISDGDMVVCTTARKLSSRVQRSRHGQNTNGTSFFPACCGKFRK